MSQVTNLNVSPYFDDFDANNDYYKVLFKPGYPVQARELTTLQSILQNQIEKFGQHFFKEGAKVIPGNTSYIPLYYCIELQNTYSGIPVATYAEQLVGTTITGQISGVTAIVDKVLLPEDSERGNITLYVNYIKSSSLNNLTLQFIDGENVYSNTTITSGLLGNTSIAAGTPFASTLALNCNSVGSAFSISEGVYFIRGQFVTVGSETLVLNQYDNKPNYRVGLYVNEEIVNSDIDESLNDNSQGFNNYASPGADRLKISTSLFKKSLDDFNDNNFVELATIVDGIIRTQQTNTQYNLIADEIARRTYEESGDYIVRPFDVSVKESLNNNVGNRGIFNENQFTYGGAIPSDNLAIYQVSPGKAFVRGYEVEAISNSFLDINKPRTTKTLFQQSINYTTGPSLTLNSVNGAPVIGIGNTYVLSLRDERVGDSNNVAPGKEIGVARVYDFRLESGSYNTSNKNLNEWYISLYDIQTTTEITLNEPITLTVPTHIQGKSSGASGFLKSSVTSGASLVLYDTKGTFSKNESFIIDGVNSGYVAIAVTSYGVSDIKSVYGLVGSASTFSANALQVVKTNVGLVAISSVSSGISTVTSSDVFFPGNIFKKGNIVEYSDPSLSTPVYAKVVSVGSTFISISGITTVSGVCDGKLPSSPIDVTDFKILTTNLSSSIDNTLYTNLPKKNISSVDLTDASLTIRKSFTVNITSNQLSTPVTAGDNETFLPFDEERYFLIKSNGDTEVLTSDKFDFIDGSKQIQIYNLGSDDTGATLVATLRKVNPKEKVKKKNRVNSLIVNKSKYQGSGIGGTTLNDGLSYGNYPYGTRVQDKNICLNVPDIIEVHGIYESVDTTDPSAPKMTLSSINGPSNTTTDLVIGEKITNQDGTTVAIVAEKLTNSQISFIYKNQNIFKEGDSVTFKESKIQAVITSIDSPSFNVSFNYDLSIGQKGTFYDYGFITRKAIIDEPNKKIKIYFSNAFYDSTDDGDITTVNSYNTFDYTNEIKSINGVRNTDIIDIRPRVSSYNTSENSRSPFEFYGRLFNGSGNSSSNILASDEDILTNFSFYLGRIDRIYFTKDGKFQVIYGTPAERPEKPTSIDDALELASIELPPYLYSISDASIRFLDHKRYRMVDIRQLENRIKNLEYYTALSLLETNTANLYIADSKGFNRFKSGFFVDNFTTFLSQETDFEIKNSINIKNKILRPKHYTTSVDLLPGPVDGVDPNEDLSSFTVEGNNIRKTGDIVTLDYSEEEWLKQSFGTRTESVTPFLVNFWKGTLSLTPSSDTWVDTVRLEAKIINVEGDYARVLADSVVNLGVDPQTGFAPTVWNSWIDNWTGQQIVGSTSERTEITKSTSGNTTTTTTTVYQDNLKEVIDTGVSTRNGLRTVVSEQIDKTSLGDRSISRNLITFMRSRNIQFVAKQVKPSTRFFGFFDGIDVTKYCVPKLLEISMVSGVFEVGETVIGTIGNVGLFDSSQITSFISFRIAQSNHKEGPYDLPLKTFSENPYTNQSLQTTYSSTSTILNVDTFSLCNEPQGAFSGWVEPGMTLLGSTSGAIATITDVKLVSDLSATLIGSLYIPDPNKDTHPRFETGTKVLTFTNNPFNDQNSATTVAEERFISSGLLETVQENVLSVRNAKIDSNVVTEEKSISKTSGAQVVGSTVLSEKSTSVTQSSYSNYSSSSSSFNFNQQSGNQSILGTYAVNDALSRGLSISQIRAEAAKQGLTFGSSASSIVNCSSRDPLAQSFFVDEDSGIFLTRCDVFFKTKDTNDIPVTVQIRTMQNGLPSEIVVPFSEVILDPDEIQVSDDGSTETSVIFKSPVYLEGGKEYCICLLSYSTNYSVFISRVGENDLITQTFISNQPYLGSLFKSQNASTWEPSQWEDLKFTLYRANFVGSGTFEIYSPELSIGNRQIPNLLPNSLRFTSRKVRIALGSTLSDNDLTLGNTILQSETNATANYVGNAGIATGTLNVINSGIGYTPSSGSFTFGSVNLKTVTGNGSGAVADVTINNGVAIAATIISGGNGYQVGDVLGISSIGNVNVGRNIRFSLSSISNINEIIVDNVQGDFVVGSGKTVQFINNLGITTNLNASTVTISNIVVENDGLHIKVNHKNHGMYFSDNLVRIYNAKTDIKPTKLLSPLSVSSNGPILVDDSTSFSTFENVGVGTTNPGYLLIGDEIIEYTNVSTGSIGGDIVRGTDLTQSKNYPAGTTVYKYELNGISLRRINKIHDLNDVTLENSISFDSYNIKLNMSQNGIDRSTGTNFPILYANQTKSSGGYDIKATQNIPFEIITPNIQNLTVKGTSLSAQLRTITGSSINGNEIPFVQTEFEPITVNSKNYLSSSRIIASRINEENKLIDLPGNKSMNMRLFLNTVDNRVSPVLDTQRMSVILTSNKVNSVITDYANDNRVNILDEDPSAFQYISKEINLENSASSIKILLSAHINPYSDIRAFYAISENPNFDPLFTPFPGYNNINSRGEIINFEDSNGLPDVFVSQTSSVGFNSRDNEFKEYTFTADQLPPFRSYRIKLVMTSTSQVYVPEIRDLRVIALA